jgi:hypothetical protein
MSFAVGMPLIVGAGFVLSLGLSFAGRLVAAPAVWRKRQKCRVTWVGGKAPDDEQAKAVWDAIVRRGLSTYGDVTRHVADRTFRSDHERAGWISDIGFSHSWYLSHACQLLERLDGRLVRINRD